MEQQREQYFMYSCVISWKARNNKAHKYKCWRSGTVISPPHTAISFTYHEDEIEYEEQVFDYAHSASHLECWFTFTAVARRKPLYATIIVGSRPTGRPESRTMQRKTRSAVRI